LEDLLLSLLKTQLQLHSNRPTKRVYLVRYYFSGVLQNSIRDSRVEKAGPFDCGCSHQSVASPSSLC